MAAARKLLVLALDAANPELLRQWSADGTLPTMARLMASGLVGETRSVDGLYVGATWPSFYTGHHPGNHGIYWLDRLRPGSYRMLSARPRDFGSHPAIWELLSRAGRKVLVLDVPLTRRSPGLRGAQVVEWGVHDAAFGFQTTPRRLRGELLQVVGSHPAPARCDAATRSLDEYRSFAGQLVRGAERRAELTRHLLARHQWDFAIQVFSETHCAGHQLWHFHDSQHPGYSPETRGAVGDLLRGVYVAVDKAIGDVLAAVGDDVTVIVLSLHSMSFACGASLALPEVLRRLGVFTDRESDASGSPRPGDRSRESLLRRAYRQLPSALRIPVYRWRQSLNERLGRGTPLDLVPDRTRAFPIGLGTGAPFSGIRLNLRGREPQGTVEPGADEERFVAELIRDLTDLTDADTGNPVVARVIRARDHFPGPCARDLPDLLVEWESRIPRGSTVAGSGAGATWQVASPKVGVVTVTNSYCRTGEHRGEGMFICRGPGVTPGELGGVRSILDFAPTFARFFEEPVPSTDGVPIVELLE